MSEYTDYWQKEEEAYRKLRVEYAQLLSKLLEQKELIDEASEILHSYYYCSEGDENERIDDRYKKFIEEKLNSYKEKYGTN